MVILVEDKNKANAITHSGTFHADEVFATAFLDEYLGDIYLYRACEIEDEDLNNKIVYDIGKGKFDHHYLNAKIRPNGIKYSSFGLLWEEFGRKYLENIGIEDIEEIFNAFDKELVEQIDAIDNGEFPKIEANYKVKTISDVIKIFNPAFNSIQDEGVQFLKAVSLSSKIIEEILENVIGKQIAKKKLEKILKDNKKDYLLLDEYMPYEDSIIGKEEYDNILFVIYPSPRSPYCIKTLSKSLSDKKARLEIPSTWWGKEKEDLIKLTKEKDVDFCHPNGFIMGTHSKKSAVKIVENIIGGKYEEIDNN